MAGAVERIVRVPWEAVLAVLAGGLAIGAAFGGWGLLTDPEGLGLEEAWLDGSPFPDYTVPGLFLLLVGAGMLAAAVAALRGSRLAAPAAVLTGLLLGAFLVVGIAIVGYHGWEQVELALGIGVPALLLVVVGLSALAGERRSR